MAECYDYIDALIAQRRLTPGDDLITDLIAAEEAGDRLNEDELRNLVLDILVGGVDTSQSQLAHAVRLLAMRPGPVGSCCAATRAAGAARRRGGAPLRADHAVHRADPRPRRSSTAASPSRPERSSSSPRGTPTGRAIHPDAFDITADRAEHAR